MFTHLTSKSSLAHSSQIYRCPGCNEMVDGGQLSEVLLHHQHVLDAYRLGIMRGLNAVRARPTRKGKRKANSR